jgi:hypothetical protein
MDDHGEVDLKQALSDSCNCYFGKLAEELGPDIMNEYVDKTGLTKNRKIDGITTAAGSFEFPESGVNLAWAGIGQHKDLVNPCTMMMYMGAIANGGQAVKPRLIESVRFTTFDLPASLPAKSRDISMIDEGTANILKGMMAYNVEDNYGMCQAELSMDTVRDISTEVTLYGLEQYELPTLLETHFGGSQRASVVSAAAGCSAAFATGNSNAGVNGWYLSMILHKEAHSRLGFYGYDLQDQAGAANSLSVRSDEGLIHELRGPNYPNYAMNVGHQPEYAGIAQAPHAARGDAFCTNPLIKIAFADNNNTFDFRHVRKEIAKGALREFMPSGERDIIIPSR